MSKPMITKTWLAGWVVVLAAEVVTGIATVVWLAHVVSVTGNEYSYQADSSFWTTVGFWWVGGLAAIGGILIQVSAWIGALMNTQRLADKTWFNVLLWIGMVGLLTSPIFGLGALMWTGVMIAYLLAGPDGMAVQPVPTTMPAALPTKLAPTA
jgi:hypothetical protein